MNSTVKLFLEKLIHKAFPEFSNKVTWSLLMLGTAILVMPAPTYLLFLNLVIDFYNNTAKTNVKLLDINNITPSTGVAITLILSGLIYHIIIKGFQLYAEIYKGKNTQVHHERIRDADIKLFETLLTILPTKSISIELLKSQDFGSSYHNDTLKDLENFTFKWGNADQHFHDPEIEQKTIELHTQLKEFLSFLGLSSGFIGSGPLLSIPTDRERAYDWDWPPSTRETIQKANKWSSEIYDIYCDLVATCKRKLLI